MKRFSFIMTLIVMVLVSCVPEAERATVETREVTDVTANSARVVCNVSDDGGAEVSSRGVCWDTSENPTIETALSMGAGSGIGNYECELSVLESNITYYVRAYATNEKGTAYGEQKSFTTLSNNDDNGGGGDDNNDNGNGDISDPDGEISGHGYVDLGLPSGLKWAICNVGASSPEDYGDYFAWGETSPKAEYTLENSITYDEQMSDISGNAQYDAATANWGGSWRMPTKEEMEELVNHCEFEWTQVNGVYGSKVIGPNGSCIFLPAAGDRYGSSLYNDGNFGYFWSSTPNDYDDGSYAYHLDFLDAYEYVNFDYRGLGLTVRPITE